MALNRGDEHTPGRCGACHKSTDVRWKNLYTIGSEGTWLCMPCERHVVNFINSMSMGAMLDKKRLMIEKKLRKNKEAMEELRHVQDTTDN